MHTELKSHHVTERLRTFGLIAIAFLLGSLFGSSDEPAHAQYFDKTPPPKAFLSGGARSEKVLQEISATTMRIEQQLIVIQKSIQQTQRP